MAYARQLAWAETSIMKGFGERLRTRARDLGLTDSEVARRSGLSQRRYSNYVNETVEPDLGTLVRIAATLGTTTDQALGLAAPIAGEAERVRARMAIAAGLLEGPALRMAAAMMDAAVQAAAAEDSQATPAPRRRKRPATD
jgi:transcriptional regulator with XRE-family HTH domain